MVVLGNVDDASGANQPATSSTQALLNLKADASSTTAASASTQDAVILGNPTGGCPLLLGNDGSKRADSSHALQLVATVI